MNINEAFPSKWLKADDVQGKDTLVTITHVTMEELGDDRKPAVHFQPFVNSQGIETDKGMILNKTNSTNIADLYGPDTDNWTGKKMMLCHAMTDFGGKSTPCLRLYPPQGDTNRDAVTKSLRQELDQRGDIPPPASENDYGKATGH